MKTTVLNQPISHRAALIAAVLALFGPLARAESTAAAPGATHSSDEAIQNKEAVMMAPPVIQSLTVTPGTIGVGAPAKLKWSARGAIFFTVTADDNSEPMSVTGNTVTVRPNATTTYTVTAVNAGGQSVKTITVPVAEAAASLPVNVFTGPSSSGLAQHRR